MPEELKEEKQNWLKGFFAKIREKKKLKAGPDIKANKEAERIFYKLYPRYINKDTNSIPYIKETDIGTQKDNDWEALLNQVKETRKNKNYKLKFIKQGRMQDKK